MQTRVPPFTLTLALTVLVCSALAAHPGAAGTRVPGGRPWVRTMTGSPAKPPDSIIWFWGNRGLEEAISRDDCRNASWFVRIGTWTDSGFLNGPRLPDRFPETFMFGGLVVKFVPSRPESGPSFQLPVKGLKLAAAAVSLWAGRKCGRARRVVVEAEHLDFNALAILIQSLRDELEALGVDGMQLDATVRSGDLVRDDPAPLSGVAGELHIVAYPSDEPGAPACSIHGKVVEASVRAARGGFYFSLVFPAFTALSALSGDGRTMYPSFDLEEELFSNKGLFTQSMTWSQVKRWVVETRLALPAGGRLEPGWTVEAVGPELEKFDGIVSETGRLCGFRLTGAGLFPYPLKRSFTPAPAEFVNLARRLMKMIK